MEVVRREGSHVAQVVSEPDNGIYDAMNKGLFLATGDVVAFLNSDDRYADGSVLSDVATAFETMDCDYVYGDIQMVNETGQLVRDWRTGTVPPEGLKDSQIPHPALFVRRPLLVGITPPFDTSYLISADLKQQLIFVNKLRAKGLYLRRVLSVMRIGGASTGGLQNYVAGWRESRRAFNEVLGTGGVWYTIKKVLLKLRGVRALS